MRRGVIVRGLLLGAIGMPGIGGCRSDGAREDTHRDALAVARRVPGLSAIALPAEPGASTPNLGDDGQGTLALSWQEPHGDGHRVRWRLRSPTGWGAIGTAAAGTDLLVNWADVPLMMPGPERTLVATWLQRTDQGYGIQWRRSVDGGAAWTEPASLPLHEGGPEYGFVTMTAIADGTHAAFWLDGRSVTGHGRGSMQLRAAEIGRDGTVSGRRLIDERVCDCCQTSAAATPAGPVVAYRDRSASEVRDIALAGPGLDERRVVADDGWTIAGCPVNGPAVAASTDGLAVAWFSGAAGTASVHVAFAGHHGPFRAPVAVDRGAPLGRVDVVWLDASHVLVSWLDKTQQASGEAALITRVVSRDGVLGRPWVVATTAASNAAGFPRLARTGETLVWTWTEVGPNDTMVRVAEAPVESLLGGA